MSHHVFLSYSRKDSAIMQRVKGDFLTAGLTVWTDEGIEPGTPSWKFAIEENILDAGCLVCLLSPDAAKSRWVRAELDFAELHGKPIFLILVEGDERSSIPFGFAAFQWVDIRADGQYAESVAYLIDTMQNRLDVENRMPRSRIGTNVAPLQPPDVSGILPPPFDWCEIPAGQVTLTEPGGYIKNPTTFDVGRIWIAKYPITNAQYQAFIDAPDGYVDASWWGYSDAAREWRNQNRNALSPVFEGFDFPRIAVTWYEAVAYCRWLMAKTVALNSSLSGRRVSTRWEIRLPAEQEWQRAAQGDTGRVFPWGDEFDSTRANTRESEIRRVTPVTSYPNGASPFAVMDLAGNVREWCLTDWIAGSLQIELSTARVLRGGSWSHDHQAARTISRIWSVPNGRDASAGFRVVATAVSA